MNLFTTCSGDGVSRPGQVYSRSGTAQSGTTHSIILQEE